MTRKTIISISSGAILLLLIALGAWYIQRDSTEPLDTTNTETQAANPFPFGEIISRITRRPPSTDNTTDLGVIDATTGDIRQVPQKVVETPVAGFDLLLKGNSEVLRYIEKATGRALEYNPSAGISRLTNTVVTNLREGSWAATGEKIIATQVEPTTNAQTVVFLNLKKTVVDPDTLPSNTQAPFTTETLPGENSALSYAINPEKTNVAYLVNTSLGSTIRVGSLANTNSSAIFRHPHKSWLLSWDTEDSLTLSTKPATGITGYSYLLDARDGTITTLTSGEGLLVKVSPEGRYAITTRLENGQPLTELRDFVDSRNSVRLSFTTYPEKCAFLSEARIVCAAPSAALANYPEGWLQGQVISDDNLWLIDIDSKVSTKIYSTGSDSIVLDITDLRINSLHTTLYFKNKQDDSIWSIRIPK